MREFEFKTAEINTKDIFVDPKGQRDVDRRTAQFNKIMRNFNPNRVQDIQVAFIDGKYYCFDGQMTMKVLKARNKGKDLPVRCRVHFGMTLMDCAEAFNEQRGIVSNVDKTDKIRVAANYGDKDAMDFIRLTEKNGLYISWSRTKAKYAVIAVSTLFSIFKRTTDKREYESLIRIIRRSWDGDPEGVSKPILLGMEHFIKCYKNQYNEALLIRRLSSVPPKEIIRNAAPDRSTGPRKYAVQILQAYNFKTRSDMRLPNLL